MTDLSGEAIRLLAHAARGGILSFKPREDPLIAQLLDDGYLIALSDADPEYETLPITKRGLLAVTARQASPDHGLPPAPWE
jgi:hypothetical protein